ncbi:Uncharacterised protein [Mycobacteroides abscessus subsp. abscessus]|nr:Uncharacterised protein [Mycobacteroides abscessus subsp. abscessus]
MSPPVAALRSLMTERLLFRSKAASSVVLSDRRQGRAPLSRKCMMVSGRFSTSRFDCTTAPRRRTTS